MLIVSVAKGQACFVRPRRLNTADGIDDLSFDRKSLPAQVRHVDRKRAIGHGLGAPFGDLVQELAQSPAVMGSRSQYAENNQFLIGRRVVADRKQPGHLLAGPLLPQIPQKSLNNERRVSPLH